MLDLNAVKLLLVALGLDGVLFPQQAKLTNNLSFDYIIVGGGTAGCVLGTRLAEDKEHSVLILEDGGDPNAISLLPGLFFTLPKTSIDYDYQSTYNDYAATAQGNKTKLTSGNVLGGSSVLHHLLNIRDIPLDFDNWAAVTGDDSWKYTNLLPSFIKSENVKDKEIYKDYSTYHGNDGPVGVKRLVSNREEVIGYLKAQAEAGNPTVKDLSGAINTGYTQPLFAIARNNKDDENEAGGYRQTPALVYLNRVKDNSNLYVSKETRVSKVIIENKIAVGVEAIYKGKTYTFRANKEVIITAGAFDTPPILQRSGVGPKDHLESLGIDVVLDLPVGDNLIIPTAVCVVIKTKKHFLPVPNPLDLLAAAKFTELPFPVVQGSAALDKSSNIPDYQVYSLILPHDTPFLTLACTSVYGYKLGICTNWQKQVISRDAIYSVIVNLGVKSRGTVRLNSTDPFDKPVIETGFYNNKEDLVNMVKKVKDYVSIVKTPSYEKLDAAVVGVDFTECADKEYGSDEFWECYVLNRSISPYLYMGSTPMGTVVDGDLKVKGIDKLRIVGSSTFPEALHGATNAAVIAQAEKAADKIKSCA